MGMYMEGNGWRNEDDEGPVGTLRTKDNWRIFKDNWYDSEYRLKNYKSNFNQPFPTIEAAKRFADSFNADKKDD